jgi:hypothetical protein
MTARKAPPPPPPLLHLNAGLLVQPLSPKRRSNPLKKSEQFDHKVKQHSLSLLTQQVTSSLPLQTYKSLHRL